MGINCDIDILGLGLGLLKACGPPVGRPQGGIRPMAPGCLILVLSGES